MERSRRGLRGGPRPEKVARTAGEPRPKNGSKSGQNLSFSSPGRSWGAFPLPCVQSRNQGSGGDPHHPVGVEARDGEPSRAADGRRSASSLSLEVSPLPCGEGRTGFRRATLAIGCPRERGRPGQGPTASPCPSNAWRSGSEPEELSGFFPLPSFEKSSRGFVQLLPARMYENRAYGSRSGKQQNTGPGEASLPGRASRRAPP